MLSEKSDIWKFKICRIHLSEQSKSKMTKSDKLPTIGQAATSAGVSKEAFQKRIIRALKDDKLSDLRQKWGINSATPTGLRDAFTPKLSALLSASGFDVPTVFPTEEPDKREEKQNADASWSSDPVWVKAVEKHSPKKPVLSGQPEKTDTPEKRLPSYEELYPTSYKELREKWSDSITQYDKKKPDANPPTNPDKEIRQPEPDKKPDTTISDRFFQSEIIVLSALLILIFSDGFSMSLLAGRTFGGSGLAYVLFSVVGLIIGYSAISTTRAAYQAPRRAWEKSWASFWIILFAIFQTALHGSAFDLFGDWSDLVGRVLIVLSIPLATASLTTTILKR